MLKLSIFNRRMAWIKSCCFVLAALLLMNSLPAQSQDFAEGTHYSIISDSPVTNEKGVTEYFSFSCPGCFAIEPHITALVGLQPKLNFRRVHMPFGGSNAKISQKAFALMESLDGAEHTDAIFSQIHVARKGFRRDQDVIDFFQGLGYERELLEKTINSFAVDAKIRNMNKVGSKMRIRSVPTIIVNGKYQVNVALIRSSAYLSALVDFLNQKK